jgi:hypothetical protein|tara:strand:- start:1618 stop:2244 length:627 start_codon:yes stop_codon:yes gene_type:complete
MVTKIPHSMTSGVIGTSNVCSQTPSGKSGGNAGLVVQLDSNGEIPPALLSPCIDQHRITADQAITASAADINSTWERVDTTGQGTTTTLQVSQTSGKFVFPVTGIYLVTLHCQIARTATNIDLITAKVIHSTNAFVDDSTNTTLAQSVLGVTGSLPKEVTALSTVVNVTSILNQRIKFTIEADDTGSKLEGSGSLNNTYATFLRVAGT